jgi:hypothetical protein
VKYLLQFTPDVEVGGGEDDDTPLLLATKGKRVAIVYELIKHGAKLSSTDRVRCLSSQSMAYRFRSMEIIVFTLLYAIAVEILQIFSYLILVIRNIYIDPINAVKLHIKLMLVYRKVFSLRYSDNVCLSFLSIRTRFDRLYFVIRRNVEFK